MDEHIDTLERRLDLAVRALKGEFKRDGGHAEFHRLWAEAGEILYGGKIGGSMSPEVLKGIPKP